MNDDKLTDCPLEECDGSVKRLLGIGAGIIFKGGGFYETDYRSESYKSGAKAEKDASEKKSDTADSKDAKKDKKAASSKTATSQDASVKNTSTNKSGKKTESD